MGTVLCICGLSYSEGWGWRIAWVQELRQDSAAKQLVISDRQMGWRAVQHIEQKAFIIILTLPSAIASHMSAGGIYLPFQRAWSWPSKAILYFWLIPWIIAEREWTSQHLASDVSEDYEATRGSLPKAIEIEAPRVAFWKTLWKTKWFLVSFKWNKAICCSESVFYLYF